jgi:hypothetical protein
LGLAPPPAIADLNPEIVRKVDIFEILRFFN